MMRAWAAGCALLAGCSETQVKLSHGSDAPVRVVERLECPEREGGLRRVSAAADGTACAYRGADGAEVELRLARAGDLPGLDAELRALVPEAAPPDLPDVPEMPDLPDLPDLPERSDGSGSRVVTTERAPAAPAGGWPATTPGGRQRGPASSACCARGEGGRVLMEDVGVLVDRNVRG